jgi:ERCC4-type nuclease
VGAAVNEKTEAAFDFPALSRELEGFRPTVAIDTREILALTFTRLKSRVVTLPTADYSLFGGESWVAIEKKGSLDELITCITTERARFERELQRMKSYPFRRLVVIGSRAEIEVQRYRSRIAPKSVLNTLSAFEFRYALPICFFPTVEDMALQVESWIFWTARQVLKDANALLKTAADDNPEGRNERHVAR